MSTRLSEPMTRANRLLNREEGIGVVSGVQPAERGGARRRRMSAGDREQMILAAAVEFFADNGFNAHTRLLAERLGISQALIFRYFPTKDALIERVYERTFLSRWNPMWETLLRDRSRPLEARLKAFYVSYLGVVDDRNWIRIAMHSSLEGNDLTRRYIRQHVTDLLAVIVNELRHEAGLPPKETLTEAELETAWHLQSTVIYYLIRKHVHQVPVDTDRARVVDGMVGAFLRGVTRLPEPAVQE